MKLKCRPASISLSMYIYMCIYTEFFLCSATKKVSSADTLEKANIMQTISNFYLPGDMEDQGINFY